MHIPTATSTPFSQLPLILYKIDGIIFILIAINTGTINLRQILYNNKGFQANPIIQVKLIYLNIGHVRGNKSLTMSIRLVYTGNSISLPIATTS